MSRYHISGVPITDEGGVLVGILTTATSASVGPTINGDRSPNS